ncbi:WxL domain-containing protein [Lactococcus formosensis]|uniref:WxL domain-containing protein n=1 Tax=Lactococcus formosensis TaxID=1281486 RepID=UPI001BCD3AB0|nr:WxL domain-containing protein [Lactococcus formosensis]
MKKQIKFMSASVLALIAVGALAPPATVEADPVANFPGWGAVGFEVPTDPTHPVDPEDPSEPIDPEEPIDPDLPVGPGTPGPLSIDFASNFYFGQSNPISATNQTINARLQPTTEGYRPNFVQVTDNRGLFTGWTLQVTASQFEVRDDGSDHYGEVLTGAQMSWHNGTIVSVSPNQADGHTATHTFTPGVAQNALWATAGNGAGTSLLRFGTTDAGTAVDAAGHASSSVRLMVPGGTAREALYTSTITWTLSDTPPV